MTSGPDPGELPGFWGSMVFRHAPIPRKGSGKQQQQRVKIPLSEHERLVLRWNLRVTIVPRLLFATTTLEKTLQAVVF